MDFSKFKLLNHGSVIALIGILTIIEWVNRRKEFPLQNSTLPVVIRWAIYLETITIRLFTSNSKP